MKSFQRFPHVRDLITHYAKVLDRPDVTHQLDSGVGTAMQAEVFSAFIWRMVERMNQDERNGIEVMGASNNTEMIPDVYYEVSAFMAQCGFEPVWRRVCAEA